MCDLKNQWVEMPRKLKNQWVEMPRKLETFDELIEEQAQFMKSEKYEQHKADIYSAIAISEISISF